MKSQIYKIDDVKIFVLYLIHQINLPMTYSTLDEIVQVTEHVKYIDFAEAFYQMVDTGLLEPVGKDTHDDDLFYITQKGILVAEQLSSEFRTTLLRESTLAAFRYLRFTKDQGITTECNIRRTEPDRTFDVEFSVRNKEKSLFHAFLNVATEEQARKMSKNFYENPDVIMKGVFSLMIGDVNYLWGVQNIPKSNPDE